MEEYLNRLAEQIRFPRAREAVRRELQAHIEDQAEAFLLEGMSEEDAREAAVREMGDPVEVGGELDRIHRPRMPWRMILFSGAVGAVGLLLRAVLQARLEPLYDVPDIGSARQFLYLLLGVAVMIGVCCFDYSRIGKYARRIYLVLAAALLLWLPFRTVKVNGMGRWIYVTPGIQISAIMVLLLFIPLYAAILYSCRGQGYKGMFANALLWMVPPIFFAWRISSVYTMALLLFTFLLTFTVAVCSGWYRVSVKKTLFVTWGGGILAAGTFVYVTMQYVKGYQAMRLMNYMQFAGGNSFQASAIRQVLNSCKMFGSVPEDAMELLNGSIHAANYTLSYIFAYFGIAAGVCAIGMILALILRFFHMAFHQKNQMGKLMGVACSGAFLVQLALYLLENLGLTLTDSYCPFLSYGGSGMVITYALCGIMLSICRYETTFPEEGIPVFEKEK